MSDVQTVALEQDRPVADGYAVLAGGDYPLDALVECYRVVEPSQVVAFPASFIAGVEDA